MTEQNLEKCFQALANKNRLAIFNYLRDRRLNHDSTQVCNVGDVAAQFDLALSTVSHHLKILHEAGLINCEQHGQFVSCSVNQPTINELQVFFTTAASPESNAKSLM